MVWLLSGYYLAVLSLKFLSYNVFRKRRHLQPPRSATTSSLLSKKRKIRVGYRAHSTKLSTDAKALLSQD